MIGKYEILLSYQDRFLDGIWVTLKLSLWGLLLSLVIGLMVCFAKQSKRPFLRYPATGYTSILRGVPDLVQLFLFFYGLQRLLIIFSHSDIAKVLGIGRIQLNNFVTAVITIGIMFGAYMAETFRGALNAIPKGQFEAAYAYGLSRRRMFRDITFPQMLRYALPGLSNNWLVLMKTTALVSLVQVDDLTKVVKEAATNNPEIKADFSLQLAAYMAGALGYLALTTISIIFIMYLRARYSRSVVDWR